MKKFTILGSLVLICLLNSCVNSSVLTARGNTTFLPDDNKYVGADIQFGTEIIAYPKGHLDGMVQLGYGKANLSNEELIEVKSIRQGFTAGAGFAYFFSNERFQPFIGLEMGGLFASNKKDNEIQKTEKNTKDTYVFFTPNAGFRFYLTNMFAVTGTIGYQHQTIKINKNDYSMGGITPSLGIVYVIRKR